MTKYSSSIRIMLWIALCLVIAASILDIDALVLAAVCIELLAFIRIRGRDND